MKQSLRLPLALLGLFLAIALWRWEATGKIFYLLNFGFIGLSLAGCVFLDAHLAPRRKFWARRLSLILVGGYMLGFVGLVKHENMQIEGFFFYLFSGVFAGATLHYVIAKVLVPLIWGRAWCGWACWTAALLDLLPWHTPDTRVRGLGMLRYIHFALSLGLVLALYFLAGLRMTPANELIWLLAGNGLYYGCALVLAWALKDNRAFCKYVCPITVNLKLAALSLSKFAIDPQACIQCGQCERACPMDIALLAYASRGKRVLSTECIYCFACVNACPTGAVRTTWGLDASMGHELRRQGAHNPKSGDRPA